ncbi:MAG: uncharacterized protein KVP18_000292 [Porospora cf. gigantea A]|uniref:uncharacterized protein n=1 Tax=Porospora cf. gigantea A TaxID=2853593 RepID=UPI0035593804|nr:MAG: hypothetical protein KVP18_000292 [Porospora cf. gigantea A]
MRVELSHRSSKAAVLVSLAAPTLLDMSESKPTKTSKSVTLNWSLSEPVPECLGRTGLDDCADALQKVLGRLDPSKNEGHGTLVDEDDALMSDDCDASEAQIAKTETTTELTPRETKALLGGLALAVCALLAAGLTWMASRAVDDGWTVQRKNKKREKQ